MLLSLYCEFGLILVDFPVHFILLEPQSSSGSRCAMSQPSRKPRPASQRQSGVTRYKALAKLIFLRCGAT